MSGRVCSARWFVAGDLCEHRCEETGPHTVHVCVLCDAKSDAGQTVDPRFDAFENRHADAEAAEQVKRVAEDLAAAIVLSRRTLIDHWAFPETHAAVVELNRMADTLLAMAAGAHRTMLEVGRR